MFVLSFIGSACTASTSYSVPVVGTARQSIFCHSAAVCTFSSARRWMPSKASVAVELGGSLKDRQSCRVERVWLLGEKVLHRHQALRDPRASKQQATCFKERREVDLGGSPSDFDQGGNVFIECCLVFRVAKEIQILFARGLQTGSCF